MPGDENYAKIPPVGKLRKSSDAGMIGDGVMVGTPDEAIAQLEEYRIVLHSSGTGAGAARD